MWYKPKHFKWKELVYPELYRRYKNNGKLYQLVRAFDINALRTLDILREFMDLPVYVNMPDKGVVNSGLRHPINKAGTPLSQHVYGRAFDPKFYGKRWNTEKLREHMKSIGCFEEGFLNRTDEEARPFLLIKRIEWLENMSWFHFDTFDDGSGSTSITIFPRKTI